MSADVVDTALVVGAKLSEGRAPGRRGPQVSNKSCKRVVGSPTVLLTGELASLASTVVRLCRDFFVFIVSFAESNGAITHKPFCRWSLKMMA